MAARALALAAGLLLACVALPSGVEAVDRGLGAGVPKPAATGMPWSADATRLLTRDIDALLDGAATLRGAHVGLLAIDTRSGAVLYARNADDAFVPASTLKLLTGSVALAKLAPEYRFRTQALLDPAGAALTIRAGGDPLLSAADLNAMAQNVRRAGVTALPGDVQVDASAFESAPYPPGWSWDDLPYDYAPALSAASVEENVIHLTVTTGAHVGALVSVLGAPSPFERVATGPSGCRLGAVGVEAGALGVEVFATTSARGAAADAVDVARTPDGCIAVSGSLPLGSEPQTIDAAVPNPAWYVRALARYALRQAGVAAGSGMPSAAEAIARDSAGIGVTGERLPSGSRVVWTHDGEPLSDLLADMWWPSDNLIAELLLKAVGRQASGMPGTLDDGAQAERAWLTAIGVDPATLTIADGSGLSSYDRLTPRALGAILQADWNGPFREIILDDLPLAGVRGTLEHSFLGSLAERRTYAKTGSVNHTRGLAGYLATLHHGALTFVWSVDDWMGNDADLNALRAKVLTRMIGD